MTDIIARLRNDVSLFSKLDWQEHVALAREAADEIERLDKTVADMERRLLRAQEWYWPEDDTSSDACMDNERDYVLAALPGEVVGVSCGGVVWTRYFAWLPPADDATTDDEFWVDAATKEDAELLVKAKQDRRTKLGGESQ